MTARRPITWPTVAILLGAAGITAATGIAGYHIGREESRPRDMMCVADDNRGNASVDVYGADGGLDTTARIPQQLPISVLFEGGE